MHRPHMLPSFLFCCSLLSGGLMRGSVKTAEWALALGRTLP